MKIKRKASFKLFTYGKNKDRYQIRMRVTFLGQRLDIGTGCQVNSPNAWDETTELVKNGAQETGTCDWLPRHQFHRLSA